MIKLIVTFEAELISTNSAAWPTLRLGRVVKVETPALLTNVENASVERAVDAANPAFNRDPVWDCNCTWSGKPHRPPSASVLSAYRDGAPHHTWVHDEESDRAYRARQR